MEFEYGSVQCWGIQYIEQFQDEAITAVAWLMVSVYPKHVNDNIYIYSIHTPLSPANITNRQHYLMPQITSTFNILLCNNDVYDL